MFIYVFLIYQYSNNSCSAIKYVLISYNCQIDCIILET